MTQHDSTTPHVDIVGDQVEFTWSDADNAAITDEVTYTQGEVSAMLTTWNDQVKALRDELTAARVKGQADLESLNNVHRARIDKLMSVASRRADENSLCHVFEQTMIECGEPFDGFFDRVTMDITFTVTITQDVLADRRARRHDLTYMQRRDVQSTYYAEHMIRAAMRGISGEYGYAPILESSDYAPVNHVFPKFVDVVQDDTKITVVSCEAINGHEAGDARYGDVSDNYNDDNDEDY
jgi:hypothetical protein